MKRKLLLLMGLFTLSLAAQASSLPDYPFIFQTGTARVEVPPDMAVMDITVSSRGADAAKTLAVVNASAAEIFQSLAQVKIPQADIQSSNIMRSLDYASREKRDAPPVYVINRNLRVWVRDLAAWTPLVSQLAAMKNITRLDTEFKTSAHDAIVAELDLKAAKDAEAKAARAAKSFNRKIASVMAISEVSFQSLERTLMHSGSEVFAPPPYIPPADASSAVRAPGSIALEKSVHVLFKLE